MLVNVKEFIKGDKGAAMYRVIDATKQGYMTSPVVLIEADRNVVIERYGHAYLEGFAAIGKNKIALYVNAL